MGPRYTDSFFPFLKQKLIQFHSLTCLECTETVNLLYLSFLNYKVVIVLMMVTIMS